VTLVWFGLYLPQVRMSFDSIVERTLAAEAAGFDSVWLMDHLAAPMAPEVDTLEGWTVASALAARTSTIRIGHLVLCDPFRHPALLAKMAASLDVISNGRLELGLGWGSVPQELDAYGFGGESPAMRAAKMQETLDILALMFAGEAFDYQGEHFTLRGATGRPIPVQPKIPVHIGGGGRQLTMPLVARYADWWNCPGYAPTPAERDATVATVERRFGSWGGVVAGTVEEVATKLAAEVERGVDGFVLQFSDFGTPDTINCFMQEVATVVRAAKG
jgi:alkanesulfonate monooxygenase SsuD/methylene tetrahydromethanopterin reductase-like flavin-dependent oxidoreductase (luciferase family)